MVLISIFLLGLGNHFELKDVSASHNRGTTLYVGGNGPNNYTRIQDAIDNASSGDTVFVYNGTYHENIIVYKSINLLGEDKNNTIIDGGRDDAIVDVSADWVNISGFTIQNSSSGWYKAGIFLSSSSNYNTIKGNTLINNYYGIWIHISSNNTLINNTFSNNNGDYGVYLDCSNNNTLITNTANNNAGGGFRLTLSNGNTLISNTARKHNSSFGIYIHSSNNNILTDNILANNNCGIELDESSNNNILTNNTAMNNNYGISVYYSSDNILTGNIATNNDRGIYLFNSRNTNLTRNIANNNIGSVRLQFMGIILTGNTEYQPKISVSTGLYT